MISVHRRLDGRQVVVSVSGELDETGCPALRAALAPEAVLDGGRKVVVDVSGLTFCDSSGLGVFVGAWKQLREAGRQLVLLDTPERLARRMQVTGLDQLITTERSGRPGEAPSQGPTHGRPG